MVSMERLTSRQSISLVTAMIFAPLLSEGGHANSAPEKLLPEDTLLLITIPDFQKLAAIYRESPEGRLLHDSAMKPFVEKFMSKCADDFLKPLQRDLNVNLERYAELLQGQLTFAVIQNGWQ